MITNVEVEKNTNENTASLIRRFTKRVQGSGILPRMRKIRYRKRTASKYTTKKGKLTALKKREAYEELVKLGKAPERQERRRFRR
jgi:ribosomal protein S21